MELKWDDTPVTGPIEFSRDVFEKCSLAPTIQELYAFLQGSDVKTEEKSEKPDGSSSEPKTLKSEKDDSENNTSLELVDPPSDCSQSQPDVKPSPVRAKDNKAFPEPLLPYPRFSNLKYNQRRAYLHLLKSNKLQLAYKGLRERVTEEVTEFMKYLQDVFRACPDTFNYMPQGGTRYTEEYFTACLEHMKTCPQVYSIQEITSLTGGKFVAEMSLNFEKQLLAMGHIDLVGKKLIPFNTQLAVDYEAVSSAIPPAKKASSVYTAISSDSNAEKLSATYAPHVCLSKEAFLQLLNNNSEFTETWELPVWVKANPTIGNSQCKTVYIDSPLLKTDMSWRERNLLFHEESVKLSLKKTASRPVFFLASEDHSNDNDPPPEEKNSRNVVAVVDADMDFEVDLTDLESFGESYRPNKKVTVQNEPKTACTDSSVATSEFAPSLKKPTASLDTTKDTTTSEDGPTEPEDSVAVEIQGEANSSLVDKGNGVPDESSVSEEEHVREGSEEKTETQPSVQCPPVKRPRQMMEDKLDRDSDSDEERLVIDHMGTPQRPPLEQTQTASVSPKMSSPKVPDPAIPIPTNPLGKGIKKGVKRQRVSGECDQLGQILRMQDAMLKSTPSKNQEPLKAQTPEDKPPESRTHSLVKPCVTSYLESREGQGEDAALSAAVCVAVPALAATQRKRLLKEDLQASTEDEQDYDPPAEGSVLYKLYSLQDILLMVRSSVNIALPRHKKDNFKAVPVHILPKLEYQLCYGAESLTHTEACHLWAEKLLHSSTLSFISRINAHTSEVAQMQELQADWMQNVTCDFKPARCLNILYNLLKKVSALQEGRYLLVHKPREGFVSIFKASDGNKSARTIYNLQAVHCGPPAVPPGVPWVPLDPLHVLPYHLQNNRPPCTFPPLRESQAQERKGPQHGLGKKCIKSPQRTSQNQASKKKKKKRKNKKKANSVEQSEMAGEHDGQDNE